MFCLCGSRPGWSLRIVPKWRDDRPKGLKRAKSWRRLREAYATRTRRTGTNVDFHLPCLFMSEMSVCLFVCLFVCLSVCLFVCCFVCLPVLPCLPLLPFLPFLPFPTSNTAYAARISTNIIQMPTQASAHHLNAYANTSQDIVYPNWSFLLKNVAHMDLHSMRTVQGLMRRRGVLSKSTQAVSRQLSWLNLCSNPTQSGPIDTSRWKRRPGPETSWIYSKLTTSSNCFMVRLLESLECHHVGCYSCLDFQASPKTYATAVDHPLTCLYQRKVSKSWG